MGSTAYDRFISALGAEVNPPSDLPLVRQITPTAGLAWATEFLLPPLADRAFAYGSGQTIAQPAVGRTGAVILTSAFNVLLPPPAGVPVDEEVPCWFWIRPGVPFAHEDLSYVFTMALSRQDITSAVTINAEAQNMAPQPARLRVVTAEISVPLTGLFPKIIYDNRPGTSGRSYYGWEGPFFKPAGRVVLFRGETAVRTQVQCNFRWLELPKVR